MEKLNEGQLKVLDFILKNPKRNCFITGCAGVGKTYLIKIIIEKMKVMYDENQIAVTSTTGISALNIDGQTLHSFTGCGIDGLKQPPPHKLKIWRNTKTLIVDEISMLGIEYFENIFKYLKTVRLIFIGDFLQLPPVKSQYAFESLKWQDLNFKNFKLTEVVRQSDLLFIKALNELRINEVSKDTIAYLHQFENKAINPDATKLYAVNRGVDIQNTKRLEELKTASVELKAVDTITRSKYATGLQKEAEKVMIAMLDKEIPIKINVKIGAYVMMTRNDQDKRFVNGTRGVISGFTKSGNPLIVLDNTDACNTEELKTINDETKNTEDTIESKYFIKSSENDKENDKAIYLDPVEVSKRNAIEIDHVLYDASYKGYKTVRSQYPLKLAWALTIHKSQGLTLNNLNLNINGTFEKGQCYTGISRVKNPENLTINDVDTLLLYNRVSPEALEFWNNLEE
jgi:ATP-dependent DNA helicase PIF1